MPRAKDMQRVRYIVTRDNEGYEIELRGRTYGPYSTKHEAVQAAVDVAKARAGTGKLAEVVVDEGGLLRKEWPPARTRSRRSLLSAILRRSSTLH